MINALLEGIDASDSDELRRAGFGSASPQLGMARFLQLDDVSIEAISESVLTSRSRTHLSARATIALRALTGDDEYALRWLRSDDSAEQAEAVDLPTAYFGEHFEDLTHDDQRLVRVTVATGSDPVPLNSLGGPYCGVTSQARALLPIRGDVLLFEPTKRQAPVKYRKALNEGWLGAGIKESLVYKGRLDETDTTTTPGFTGPSVFISYCVDDIAIVTAIVDELRRRRRQYYLIALPYQGVGGTPAANSADGPMRTEACIMVTSVAYQDRIHNQPIGKHHEGASRAVARSTLGVYPIVPLATAHFSALDSMPWPQASWLLRMDS